MGQILKQINNGLAISFQMCTVRNDGIELFDMIRITSKSATCAVEVYRLHKITLIIYLIRDMDLMVRLFCNQLLKNEIKLLI